jgi:hypothetical protein
MPHFPEDMAMPRPAVETKKQMATAGDANTYRVRVKNRRMRYLSMHPDYFKSADLELAGRA